MCIFFIAPSPVLNRCSKQIKQLPFSLSASIFSHKKLPQKTQREQQQQTTTTLNKLPLVNEPKYLNTKNSRFFCCPPTPIDVEVSFHFPQSQKYFITTFTAFSMSPNCSFPHLLHSWQELKTRLYLIPVNKETTRAAILQRGKLI